MRIRIFYFPLVLIFTLGMVLTACGSKSSTQAPASNGTAAPVADGQTIMNTRCNRCHALTRVTSAKHTAAEWTQTIARMVQHGAQLTSGEQKVLIDYLAKNYHP